MGVAACAPHKIIPDEELALIFRDAFLANAYITSERVETDSLKVYEPIFASYGYTTDDVHYTIGNFSKRKSARLGDVVEMAIDMLEQEGDHYDHEVAILDTVDNVARRTFRHTVHADTLIRVKSLRDTAKLSFTLDVVPGEYRVDYSYKIDSLDKNNKGLRCRMWLDRADSTRAAIYTTTLRRFRESAVSHTFTTDTTHRSLRMQLMEFVNKSPERPDITVTGLTVTYTTPTEAAVDSLYRKQLDIRIFAGEFFGAMAAPEEETTTEPASEDEPAKDSLP